MTNYLKIQLLSWFWVMERDRKLEVGSWKLEVGS